MNTLLNARLLSLVILTMAVTVATTERPSAAPPADSILLAPHRAIYDLSFVQVARQSWYRSDPRSHTL